jgi:hypothetical protein
LPSVTSIIDSILRKPALEAWKTEQAVLSVMTSPRLPGEADDVFVHRILHTEEVQNEEAAAARNKGTEIHKAIEARLSGQEPEPDMVPWIAPAAEAILKLGSHVTSEKILVGNGYAGKTDLIQETETHWLLWDYKSTKKLPDPNKGGAWTEHVLQLAAYAASFWKLLSQVNNQKPIRTANCYISTVEQGKFVICDHDPDWQKTFNQGFAPLVQHWCWKNNYRAQQ